ncbi:acyl carrier protein [Actinokineospora bangkokensis]|uniref:Acyl carrier protein n=1 Tax=Actinokineospora bangkokensis TaxID=1193682 RepID=A0A1Q9LJJ3_9PSEU|nr:phosphopantetheine-binding protein [Actinokineospora bangkokensis]OLR92206.1 acyl carrier protein [Actinokineospora bangkokensis]
MSAETISDTLSTDPAVVLAELSAMLRDVLDEYGLDDVEITPASTFHGDLELESVDLVALSGSLREHYGSRVNFAEFIAARDLDEIISLTVGDLVDHVVTSLEATR